MKQVQIDEELFINLYKYFNLDQFDEELHQKCKLQLQDKIDKIIKRQIYTNSKTASTQEEREQSRQKYLDMIGMGKDWKY